MDLAGIRMITYFESDVYRVCEVVKQLFEILPDHPEDKREKLGVDKVGYRSVHFVAEFPEKRTCLLEYKNYKGCRFELQIRSLLQHAWAEIEHDRNYKFNGVMPKHLQRRFSLVAAVLELAR